MNDRLLVNSSIISVLLPLGVLFISYLRNKKLQSRVIFIYLAYSLLNDIITTIAVHFDSEDAIFIFNSLFTIFEHILILLFFINNFQSKRIKLFSYICSSIFLIIALFALYKSFGNLENTNFDSIASSISSILIIIYSIFYLYERIQVPDTTFIYGTFEFWIVVGLMIYFSGTFFFFLQASSLSRNEYLLFWKINLVCNILKNIIFAIAFLQRKKNASISSDYTFDSYNSL